MNKLAFIIIHVYLFITLANLSYLILSKKEIPVSVGYLVLSTTLMLVFTSIYFVITSKENFYSDKERRLHNKHEENRHHPSIDEILRQRGLLFDPNDPNYKPIGGVGGTGWL